MTVHIAYGTTSLLHCLMAVGLFSNNAKSSSKTPKWNLTCSHHSEKFSSLNTITDEACEWRVIVVKYYTHTQIKIDSDNSNN